ncbi:MAG: tetratricopeptide (TPR) repeat protein, partial [Polyangiales bacterium]
KAQHTYERLIELDGQNADSVLPAARALERIHLAANNTEKLADAYRQQIRFGLDEENRAQLLEKLGALLEQSGDLEGAVSAYRQRLDFDPADLEALGALERLYTNQEDWPRLIEMLRSRDAAVDDEGEQRQLAVRIGAVYQEKLNDPENAIASFNDALIRFGEDEHVLSSLASLYEGQERWQDLLEVREQQLDAAADPELSASLQFEMAELMRLRTGEEERSIELYSQVLRVLPSHEGTVAALDRLVQNDEHHIGIQAARALVPHYEAAGDHGKLIGVLQVVADGDDPEERLRSLRRAAEVADVGHDNPAQAFDLMSRAVRAGTAEESFESMLADVERFAIAAEKHEEHVQLLEEVAPEILDADLQTNVYMRAAFVARERLNDSARARTFYQSVLENRPDDVRALDALLELQASDGDHTALRVTLRRKLELEEDVAQRIELLERLAKLLEEELDDVPAAVDALEELLLEDEQRVATYQAQEALLTKAERWDDLAQLYERWLDVGGGNPVDLRHKLATVAAKHLDDPYRAIDKWREALAIDGNHEPSISAVEQLMIRDDFRGAAAELLEPVFLARMEWPRVVSALEARLTVTDDIQGRKDIHRRLGQIHEDYLEDLEGALERYAALFREEPRDQDAWDILGRLGRVLEMWERLADIYRGPVDEFGVGDDAFARLAKTAARLYDERVGDLDQTASLYGKVLDFDETDREAFDALRSVYTRAERASDLLVLLRRRVDVADSDGERLELLHTIADLHQAVGNTSSAIDVHQEAVQHMPSDARSVEALDELLTDSERFADLADHLRFRVDAAEGITRSDLELRLGRLTSDKLEDVRGAVDVYEETISRDPRHVGTITALEELVVNKEHQGRITELLEPIYRDADEWKKLVAILEARAAHAHPSDQVPLFAEIGKMHEERGNDSALAFHAWSRAFAADAADEAVRGEVDRLAGALGAWDEHVASYEVAIQQCDDPDIQSRLLMTVAQTHDERRGDPRAAIETYERLAAHDEADLAALDALEGLHTMVGDWRGLVDVLGRKVARRFDPIERAELLRRSASVLEELLGDSGAAIKDYERALEEDPEDLITLESLDRLLGAASRSEELAVILRRRSEIEADEEVCVEVGLRLGQLTETQLNQPHEAIDAFTRVLELSPTQPIAVESLGRLYERQAMWPELLDNLQVRASTAQAAEVRLSHIHRAGEVYERELDDVHEAITQYQQALELDARHEPSLAALIRISRLEDYRHQASEILEPLLHVQERWDDLAELYRTRAEGASDSFDRKADYIRLAEVEENGRRDLVASFNATAAAFGEDPTDVQTAERLERLAGETGAYDKLVDEFGTRASAVMDPEVARSLYWRVARIAENQLSNDERAIGAYQHALEQAGDDQEALEALDRLFVKGERWSNLGEVVERRITLCEDPSARAGLLIRLGELREGHFGDNRGAFAAYQEVIERDPGDARATEALERLGSEPELALDVIDVLEGAYRDTGALERVAGLYALRVNLADTDGERVRILQEASQLWEGELGRPDEAFSSLRRAAELDPLDDSMLDELERLAHACGKPELLRGFAESVVEAGSATGRALRDVHVRAARWYTDSLNDGVAAETQLRAALAIDDGTPEVHGSLVDLLRGPGREGELVVALKEWAAADSDDFNKVERLLEAARLSQSAVGDKDAAAECYDNVLALEPGHEAALRALTEIREDEEKWGEVAKLLMRRIDLEMDPTGRVELRRRVATLLAGPLENLEEATRAWEGVLDEQPTDMQAIGELETLYEAAERWEDLRELLDRRLDAATTDSERVSARVRLARLAERAFGRRDDALEQLRGVLEIDPQNGEALDELERLLTLEEDWEELVTLLERRAANAHAAGDWPAQRDALDRIANLHEEHRNDAHSALEIHGMILTAEPGHIPSLQRVVAIHDASGHTESAADALERLAPHLEAPAAAAAYHRLATMSEEQLNDAPRALAALRRAYELQPTATTRELLRTHHEQHENWTEYAMLLDAETTEVEEPEAQAALLKRIAEVYVSKLDDPGSAANYLERASRLAPDDREILLPLCDLYIAAGRQSDAVPVLRQIIESFGGRRSKELAQYHHRLGKAIQGMGDAQGAMEHFDAAFRIDLTNVAILRDLGKLALETGDLARAQKTFRALLLQKLKEDAGITKADVYFYLGSIANQEGDTRKAISMLERSLSEDSEHEAAKALLSTLK